eukprot:764898-Hanusia_phi.AAC.14
MEREWTDRNRECAESRDFTEFQKEQLYSIHSNPNVALGATKTITRTADDQAVQSNVVLQSPSAADRSSSVGTNN